MQEELDASEGGGAALAIVENGAVTFSRGFGVKEKGGTDPVLDTTLFRIASLSKSLTATGVLRLVDQGKMSLDAPVTTYIPNLALPDPGGYVPSMTMHHLLTHSAGISKGFGLILNIPITPDPKDSDLESYWTGPSGTTSDYKTLFTPGLFFQYSNAGYSIAGLAAEKASGKLFRDYMRDEVLAPLGMTRTYFSSQEVIADGDYAKRDDDKERDVPQVRPAAGAHASALDLAKLAQFWMTGNEQVLSTPLHQAMVSPQIDTQYHLDRWKYGYGVFRNLGTTRWDGSAYDTTTAILEHTGGWLGFITHVFAVPSRGVAYVLVNSANKFFSKSPMFALQKIAKVDDLTLYSPPGDPSAYAPFIGDYTLLNGNGGVRVSLSGDKLMLSSTGGPSICELVPLDPRTFSCSSYLFGWTTFIVDDTGKVTHIRGELKTGTKNP